MNIYHQQGLTFRQKALYELKQERGDKRKRRFKKKRRTYWVRVQFATGEIAWYQCSQDLQRALWQYTGQTSKVASLNGMLLNVPVGPYDEKGGTPVRTVKVLETKISRKHISYPEDITRGQFVKIDYNRFGFPKDLDNKIKYMQHDYLQCFKDKIYNDIRYFVKKDGSWLYRTLVTMYG